MEWLEKILQNFETYDDALTPSVVSELAAASLLWLDNMSSPRKWALSHAQICRLLGDIPVEVYLDLKCQATTHHVIELNGNIFKRINLLLKIANALQCIADESAYEWFHAHYAFLNNMSIKEYLLKHNSLDAFNLTYQYLDAAVNPPSHWRDYLTKIAGRRPTL